MEISTVRDFVISILGCLYIILTIGIIVGLIFIFLKIKQLTDSINRKLYVVRRWLAYIQYFAKGINETAKVFKKGGA
jgi:hypothetical protein